eukprot:4818787-Prymnesium_polylepis.1
MYREECVGRPRMNVVRIVLRLAAHTVAAHDHTLQQVLTARRGTPHEPQQVITADAARLGSPRHAAARRG